MTEDSERKLKLASCTTMAEITIQWKKERESEREVFVKILLCIQYDKLVEQTDNHIPHYAP